MGCWFIAVFRAAPTMFHVFHVFLVAERCVLRDFCPCVVVFFLFLFSLLFSSSVLDLSGVVHVLAVRRHAAEFSVLRLGSRFFWAR